MYCYFIFPGAADFDIYGGIDPSQDPELAMAIRASTEEARANEEARVKAAQEQVLTELKLFSLHRIIVLWNVSPLVCTRFVLVEFFGS